MQNAKLVDILRMVTGGDLSIGSQSSYGKRRSIIILLVVVVVISLYYVGCIGTLNPDLKVHIYLQ